MESNEKIVNELIERFEKIIELLKELRSTFLRYAVVRVSGKIPSLLVEASFPDLCGAKGLLRIVFHGHIVLQRYKDRFVGHNLCNYKYLHVG